MIRWESDNLCGHVETRRNTKTDLVKDGYGDFFYDSDVKVYWVSFLNGMQRTLLFTEDSDILYNAVQVCCYFTCGVTLSRSKKVYDVTRVV
jgi:hypothetical protein